MTNATTDYVSLGATAQNLLRTIIASYFIAASLRLVPGTDLSPALSHILSPTMALMVSSVIIFTLAFLVMIGLFMRPAALMLGALTLLSSYMTLNALGVAQELETLWRDLVLVAALVLTYSENAPRDRHMRRVVRRKIMPRRVTAPTTASRPRPPVTSRETAFPKPRKPWSLVESDLVSENIFVENGVYG